MIARSTIRAGDEITIDYGKTVPSEAVVGFSCRTHLNLGPQDFIHQCSLSDFHDEVLNG